MDLETIIGLEIHVQLKTKSKMFCACDNAGDQLPPNTAICPICTAQPGTLPVVNEQAVTWGIRVGLALGCEIARQTKFDRKNYFYPDLPKGYQISQYDVPIAHDGQLSLFINGERRTFGITRAHLEEDSAKLTHSASGASLVDFNRAGTPLIEIVTEPDFRSPSEAKAFLQELRILLRQMQVSDADMEKGHLRCDANISLRPVGDLTLYPKTEIKNLNSFRSVERALDFEITRQSGLWEAGKAPQRQETRGWDEDSQETVSQREKEELADYRYFPEPDIPPLHFSDQHIDGIKRDLPESPTALRVRFQTMYELDHAAVEPLLSDPRMLWFFEEAMSELLAWNVAEHPETEQEKLSTDAKEMAQLAYKWLTNRLAGLLAATKSEWADLKIGPEDFAEFIKLLYSGRLASHSALEVLQHMFDTGQDPSAYLEEHDLTQMGTTEDLELLIDKVLSGNPDQVAQYRSGKLAVLQFLLGQVMKASRGRANPNVIKGILIDKLQENGS